MKNSFISNYKVILTILYTYNGIFSYYVQQPIKKYRYEFDLQPGELLIFTLYF